MVAALLAVILAILGGFASHWQIGRLVPAALAGLLLLCGFIALAFRIVEGPPAPVPPGVRLSDSHRRRLFPWIRRSGVLLAAIGAFALVVPSSWMFFPLTLGGMVLLLASSVLYPLYLQARRFDRGMTALLARPWVHWEYTAEQWYSWAAIQYAWERSRTQVFRWKRDWAQLIFPILTMGGATWMLGSGGSGEKARIFMGCVAVLLVTAGLTIWTSRAGERRYRRMLAARPEAFFGGDGLYCSGEYHPWSFSGNCLIEAAALHDPPRRLILTFGFPKRNGTARVAMLIPIPEGGESDLDALEQQLRARCPGAAVHLSERCSCCSEEFAT